MHIDLVSLLHMLGTVQSCSAGTQRNALNVEDRSDWSKNEIA